MPTTSLRTLVLLLELFAAVVALQCLVSIRPARPSAVWLANASTIERPISAEIVAGPVNT